MTAKEIHLVRNVLQMVIQLPSYLKETSPEDWDTVLIQEQAKHVLDSIDEYLETVKKDLTSEKE